MCSRVGSLFCISFLLLSQTRTTLSCEMLTKTFMSQVLASCSVTGWGKWPLGFSMFSSSMTTSSSVTAVINPLCVYSALQWRTFSKSVIQVIPTLTLLHVSNTNLIFNIYRDFMGFPTELKKNSSDMFTFLYKSCSHDLKNLTILNFKSF